MSMHTETTLTVIDTADIRRSFSELTTLLHECQRQAKRYSQDRSAKGRRMFAFYQIETRETRAQLNTLKVILA